MPSKKSILSALLLILSLFLFYLNLTQYKQEGVQEELEPTYWESPFGLHGIEEDYKAMTDIGIRWYRLGIHPGPTFRQKIRQYDERYAEFCGSGLNILENFMLHGWRKLIGNVEYAELVRFIVERYDADGINDAPKINGTEPKILFWEIGNEPNIEGKGDSCPPEEYARFLKFIYPVIKGACPQCKVLFAGLVPFTHDEYLDIVLKNGGGDYFDIVSLHYYGNATGDYAYGVEMISEVKAVMAKYGINKPIWITETGTYSGSVNGIFQSEEEQAADLVKRYVVLLSAGAEKIFWAWGLHEGFCGDGNQYFDQTGLIYDGKGDYDKGFGVKKRAYYAYGLMTEKLEGFTNIEKVQLGEKNVFVFRFDKKNEYVYVVWWDWWNEPELSEKEVKIPIRGREAVLTIAVPNENGEVYSETIRLRNGSLRLKLNKSPVYIEVKH